MTAGVETAPQLRTLQGDAVFLPADPPRAGALALWGEGVVPDGEIELVLPAGSAVRRRRVPARIVPLAEAARTPRDRSGYGVPDPSVPGPPRSDPGWGWSPAAACCRRPHRAAPMRGGSDRSTRPTRRLQPPGPVPQAEGPLPGRSGKLAALDELLETILSEGESTLVFTQYVGMARLIESHLAARGVPALFLHGGVPAPRREEMVASFQAGEAPVFLLSVKAGGVGLTLTRATHVVHYDRWWNPAVEDQATDRAYRIGQDRPVQVHRLVAEGTVEDRIATLLATKRELADAVVGSGEAWVGELSDSDLADLVTLGRS